MQVEIWSDVACPWCYLGFHRFARAMSAFDHAEETSVTFRAFELDPGAPADRHMGSAEMLQEKYGRSPAEVEQMQQHLVQLAQADGLTIDPARQRLGSTFDAHRLLKLAAHHGAQHALKDRLLRAYHAEGVLVSDHAELTRLAVEVGIPEADVAQTLRTDRFTDEVRGEEQAAAQLGVRGVPFFVVDRRFGASGAQDPAELLRLLDHAWAERATTPS